MFRKLFGLKPKRQRLVEIPDDPPVNRALLGSGKILPNPGLFDTIQCEKPIERHSMFHRAKCLHARQADYVRIDHRAGPGGYADNFKGVVCCDCGRIMSERQTL